MQRLGRILRLLLVAATLVSLPVSTSHAQVCVEPVPIDHVCVPDPVFPEDCVDQLGPIGSPPIAPTDEGYLGIVAPLVDPVLRLRTPGTPDGADAPMYAINPADNSVRVWQQDFVTDIRVCYRPSALAQSADGSLVYVACHASDAIGILDTSSHQMVGLIQDRDADGRPLLQEPMGMAISGDLMYVASSQSNQIAVVNLVSRQVVRYIDIPGQDPRALTLAGGGHLIVANLLAGNRTEAERPDVAALPPACESVLSDPAALAVFEETSPTFMDTSHPDYPLIAECYFLEHITGRPDVVVVNPERPDHDLVVVRLADNRVVFSTDSLGLDVGTLNYDVAYDAESSRVYLATVHARNALNAGFGNRPLVNRLVVFDFDASTGALTIQDDGIKDLDAPFLDSCGEGLAEAATPYALDVGPTRVAIAATGSDRLVLTDKAGNLVETIPVGFGPKGVVLGQDKAWVYNATGQSVTELDLVTKLGSVTAIGPNQIPQPIRIGHRLFNSARFAGNGTFACASCHPDGHLDGLVWRLNDQDKLRSTQTLHEISETAAYHWDGSKCNLVKILEDGIVNLLQGPEPTDCEMKTMIDFMNGLVRPHSPDRSPDDSMTETARLGASVLHRATFKDADDLILTCTDRVQDIAVEEKYLTAVGDPFNPFFRFNGGGGPISNTTDSESCSVSACHVAPHTESDGLNQMGQLRDGFQAVSTLGAWDRNSTMHDARMVRASYLKALDINRDFNGAPIVNPDGHVSGVVAVHGFNDAFFDRHPEYNHDANPDTKAFALTDALTRFIAEEEELQSGAVGLSVVLSRGATLAVPSLLDILEPAADQGKINLLGVGTISGALTSLSWQPGAGHYLTDGGTTLTRAQLQNALDHGDTMLLYGGLLPDQNAAPNPKLKAVLRDTSPYLCSENHAEYQGAVQNGELNVSLTLRGIDVVPGSRVLADGQVVGAALAGSGPDFAWTLPAAPAFDSVLALQILGPQGMLSNSIPLPVVHAVIPPTEPQLESVFKNQAVPTFALLWDNQFGLTGPGTRYDVYRGLLSDLQTTGLGSGECLTIPPSFQFFVTDEDLPAVGDGFYFVVRAQNQAALSTWGSNRRDVEINAAPGACSALFP